MFEELKLINNEKIKDIIKSAFEIDLDILGQWGYSKDSATIIRSIAKGQSIEQFEFMLLSMRANIQMNMILSENERYSGINPAEILREQIKIDDKLFDKITYKISATKELQNKEFIKEYKENHGKLDFDTQAHFDKRAKCKIEINQDYWFDISKVGI